MSNLIIIVMHFLMISSFCVILGSYIYKDIIDNTLQGELVKVGNIKKGIYIA